MFVYLRTKFQVSSIILTSFRQGEGGGRGVILPKIQNSEESFRKKNKKHIAGSYGYKLVCVDDKFDKSFMKYWGKDSVDNFISSVIRERKYCSEVIKKKRSNEEPVMTKKNNEKFKNSTKCWICDNDYVDNDAVVRGHCHITGKYWGSEHADFNINLNPNLNRLFRGLFWGKRWVKLLPV